MLQIFFNTVSKRLILSSIFFFSSSDIGLFQLTILPLMMVMIKYMINTFDSSKFIILTDMDVFLSKPKIELSCSSNFYYLVFNFHLENTSASENDKICRQVNFKLWKKEISFIIVEFSFHAEKKKFIVWRSENLFSCPRAGKQAVFQL